MHRRESCRICKHRSIGKSVAEKERPILLNAKYTINEERAKSSLLILTHHIQKPLNHLIFSGLTGMEPARWYSNPEDHRAAGLCRPQNCRIKQKNPGGCRGSFALSCICWQRHHATPRIFSTLFRTSAGSRPEPFTLPAISCASTSAGSGSAGFAATPWMVQ